MSFRSNFLSDPHLNSYTHTPLKTFFCIVRCANSRVSVSRRATNECRKEKKRKRRKGPCVSGNLRAEQKRVLGLLLLTHSDLANSKEEKYERKDFFSLKKSGSSTMEGANF